MSREERRKFVEFQGSIRREIEANWGIDAVYINFRISILEPVEKIDAVDAYFTLLKI